jgi:hypothetical protein
VRQQTICNLCRLLKSAPALPRRFLFVEVGAGYGSFALARSTCCGTRPTFIVDLPETLTFWGGLPADLEPGRWAYVYAPGDDLDAKLARVNENDIAFVPNYRASALGHLSHTMLPSIRSPSPKWDRKVPANTSA